VNKLLTRACGALAASALLAIMLLTLVDVAGRKLLNASVPGSLELTELLMVCVIFAALPLVSLHSEHVVFDSLDSLLPPWLRRVQRAVVDVLCLGLLLGLAWLMFNKAGQMSEYGDTTSQLKLTLGPFVYAISLMCALAALVHAWLLMRPVSMPAIGADHGDQDKLEGGAL
jgi:TRAP-type transport system small permease protein